MQQRALPLDYKHLAEAGSMMGSAGIVVLNDTIDMAQAADWQLKFFERKVAVSARRAASAPSTCDVKTKSIFNWAIRSLSNTLKMSRGNGRGLDLRARNDRRQTTGVGTTTFP